MKLFNIEYLVTFASDIRTGEDKPMVIRHFDIPTENIDKDIEEMRDEWTLLNVQLTLQHHYLDSLAESWKDLERKIG